MTVRVTRAGVGLIIGIIVVGALVFGGLYLAKERGEQARRDDAIKIAQKNLEAQSEKGPGALTPGTPGATETETGTKTDTTGQGSTGAPLTEGGVGELPQTGPSEVLSALTAGMLTFSSVAYIRSRSALKTVRDL